MASDASDESESDSNDDGLQSLLQMHSPRVAEPSLHMRSPTAAAQFAKPAAAVEGEAPKSGWDAAATPRRRAARASCDASSSRTEPSPLPDLAEASGGQLEDWSDLWDVHSKDASHRRKGKQSRNVRLTLQREYSISARAAQRNNG